MTESHPTTAKLRHDIDHGRGRDKVDVIDPAAAPLGTDEEAAGTPPSGPAVARAHADEIDPKTDRRSDAAVPIHIGAIILLFGLIVLAAVT
jgi:hypothetical protein